VSVRESTNWRQHATEWSLTAYWTFTGHVLDMYWTCTGHVLDMYWTCTGHVLDMYWTCTGHVLDMYWTCTGHVLDMYWTCTGHVLDMYWTFTGHVLDLYWTFTGHVLDMYWTFTGHVLTHLGKAGGVFHFLGASAKLLKATIGHAKSVCSTVRPHWRTCGPLDGFSWNFRMIYFSKKCREIQISLYWNKNNCDFTWRPVYIYVIM